MLFDGTESHPKVVDFNAPLITRLTLFNCTSIFLSCLLLSQAPEHYSAVENTSARDAILSVYTSELRSVLATMN